MTGIIKNVTAKKGTAKNHPIDISRTLSNTLV